MDFNRKARVDISQISDVRRRGGFGGSRGMRLPIGGAGGLGGLGIVAVLLFFVIQSFLGGSGGAGGLFPQDGGNLSTQHVDAGQSGSDIATCNTDPDALDRDDCRLALVVNSVNAFWEGYLPQNTPQQVPYRTAVTQLFTAGTTTACGQASSAVGPFYCPADEQIYIDMSFFSGQLQQLGASNTTFVQAYVVAHEYGHHIEHILGVLEQGQAMDQSGPKSGAVRIELMADCLAGVWAHHATGTTDEAGIRIITGISDEDIQSGLQAAASIGDDHIQQQTQGEVNSESFTHGTSEQRYNWFKKGIDSGDIAGCDTFSGGI